MFQQNYFNGKTFFLLILHFLHTPLYAWACILQYKIIRYACLQLQLTTQLMFHSCMHYHSLQHHSSILLFLPQFCTIKGIWRGVSGVSGNPFDSKTISKITCLNKYTIINILASYAYLSVNTIQYLSETFMQTGLTMSLNSTHSSNIIQLRFNQNSVIIDCGFKNYHGNAFEKAASDDRQLLSSKGKLHIYSTFN